MQARLANAHGSQCGFCTPGFVMSMYALLRTCTQAPSQLDIEEALAGNLCRCTGYRPILDAFAPFTGADVSLYTDEAIQRRAAGQLEAGARAHTSSSTAATTAANGKRSADNGAEASASADQDSSNGHAVNGEAAIAARFCPSTGKPCDCGEAAPTSNGQSASSEEAASLQGGSASEPIFPPALTAGEHGALHLPGVCPRTPCCARARAAMCCVQQTHARSACIEGLQKGAGCCRPSGRWCFAGSEVSWHRPVTLAQLLDIVQAHPECKIVGGNTEVAIETNIKGARYPHLIDPSWVPELTTVEWLPSGLQVRAACFCQGQRT